MVSEAALAWAAAATASRRIEKTATNASPSVWSTLAVVREDRAADDVVMGAYRLHPARLPQATGELG